MCSCVIRIVDGSAVRIPPSEYTAWAAITGNYVRSQEFAILRAMDLAYCDAMNEELAAQREREAAKGK